MWLQAGSGGALAGVLSGIGKVKWSGSLRTGVFSAEFTAVCDTCGTTTLWFKANRLAEVDGRPKAVKGFKCAECETFESKVLDTRGQIHDRS